MNPFTLITTATPTKIIAADMNAKSAMIAVVMRIIAVVAIGEIRPARNPHERNDYEIRPEVAMLRSGIVRETSECTASEHSAPLL